VWLPVKVVSVVIVLYVAFVDHRWITPTRTYARLLGPTLVAIVLATCVSYLIEPKIADVGHGAQSRLLRPVVQAGSYVASLLVIPLALVGASKKRDLERLFAWYVYAAVGAALVAITQLVLLYTGRPFLPIFRMTGRDSEAATFQMGSDIVFRLYGFAGEPKQLAAFLLPACCIVLAALKEPRSRRPRWARVDLLVLFTMVTVLTFSTAGLIALAIALPIVALHVGKMRSMAALRLAITVVALIGVSSRVFSYVTRDSTATSVRIANSDPSFERAVYTRSVGRLADEIQTRDEYKALSYITNERPVGLLLGLGPGMYNFHLPWMHWGAGISPIDSGWVVSLLDLGIIGTGLVIVWVVTALRRALTRMPSQTPGGRMPVAETSFAAAGLIGSLCANAGTGTFSWICLFLGLLVASMRFRSAAPTTVPTGYPNEFARNHSAPAHA
jgi:hypothetical protein